MNAPEIALPPPMARRQARIQRVPELFADGGIVTAERLAETLGVSVRTIYRDIKLHGDRIRGEAGVGYVMRKGAAR